MRPATASALASKRSGAAEWDMLPGASIGGEVVDRADDACLTIAAAPRRDNGPARHREAA